MLHFPTWKVVSIVLTCLLGVLGTLPNMVSKESWPRFLVHKTIPLGLDLQGGVHLVLEMNTDELKRFWFDTIIDDVRKLIRSNNIAGASVSLAAGRVTLKLDKPEDADKLMPEVRKLAQSIGGIGFGGVGGSDLDIRREGNVVTIEPTEAGVVQRITTGMSTAIETIRRRIDALGTTEPNIVRQGQNRIVVQVPGFNDPEQLKELIGKTARLTFQFVHPDYTGRPALTEAEAKQIQVPSGAVLMEVDPKADNDSDAPRAANPPKTFEVIERRVIVAGEDLTRANQGTDQNGRPSVDFGFNQNGARKFGKATQENVRRRFAIILDNGTNKDGTRDIKVISAPQIISPILGGSGQITGSFSVRSANTLAILLRSGALPATLTIVEERTVGPSLGADSIAAGKIATYVAFGAVALFMMVAYGLFGFFSVIALILKLCLIFAAMNLMRATLTLPGIAGIALTIGIAVDANVLIYERMREELRNGKSAIAAIEAGFTRAIATIIDSQLTTLISAIILFWLGSGPIRGFGITLTIGILTAIFTAVTVTRLMISWWLKRERAAKREIEVPV